MVSFMFYATGRLGTAQRRSAWLSLDRKWLLYLEEYTDPDPWWSLRLGEPDLDTPDRHTIYELMKNEVTPMLICENKTVGAVLFNTIINRIDVESVISPVGQWWDIAMRLGWKRLDAHLAWVKNHNARHTVNIDTANRLLKQWRSE